MPLGVLLLLIISLGLVATPFAESRAAGANGQTGSSYRFGVFPYVPALTIDRIFGPIAASFADELDRPVYLKTRSTFENFAEELEKRTYDIIFVHPFFYVEAARRQEYLPLARLVGQLTAVALGEEDRPWRSWSDLAGKVIATPPALAAVSELAKVALLDAGLDPGRDTELRHYRTKVSCLQAVSVGDADVCVLPRFVLPQINEIGEAKLRIIAETPAITNLVFAVHRRVPPNERTRLRSLILSWSDTAQGRAILTSGSWPGFVAARDADYAEVRRLDARLQTLAQR